eukprot:CAMPEP_0177602498 /NCGR_PEP_ID=MMETSP0419_2-20121207/14902_1 /TAXON_ID=582737 /ORGANISM="Tetraselmis sp., Strain GSL018" /LENGTH=228 /DNA_ID=CAMNT_0019095989 /DNA_START=245 /DNA_END=932 /DNA_ORIENTATION=+
MGPDKAAFLHDPSCADALRGANVLCVWMLRLRRLRLGPPLHHAVEEEPGEHERDRGPLLGQQRVAVDQHGDEDVEELPGRRDEGVRQGPKSLDGLEDEELPPGAAEAEEGHVEGRAVVPEAEADAVHAEVAAQPEEAHGPEEVHPVVDAAPQVHVAHRVQRARLGVPVVDRLLCRVGEAVQDEVEEAKAVTEPGVGAASFDETFEEPLEAKSEIPAAMRIVEKYSSAE